LFIGVIFILECWEDFIEISDIKLEHSALPTLSAQLSIQDILLDGIPDNTLIVIVGHKLLGPSESSKYFLVYRGSKGEKGTILSPHFQFVSF
jgi:hypothetical protein